MLIAIVALILYNVATGNFRGQVVRVAYIGLIPGAQVAFDYMKIRGYSQM